MIEQIIALSCQLKPYTYWDEEACLEELLSPERGQLLQTLINTKIDTTSLMAIYAEADFSYASLQAADLTNANSKTWFTDLQQSTKPPFRLIIGVKDIMEKYKVDTQKIYKDSDEYYRIVER